MLRVAGARRSSCATAARSAADRRARRAPTGCAPEIPLPGLPDAQASSRCRCSSAIAWSACSRVESRDPLAFDEWHEAFLQIARQPDRDGHRPHAGGRRRARRRPSRRRPPLPGRRRSAAASARFVYYRNDDCVFVDGEYLIRNVPAKILWKLLARTARGPHRVHQPRAAPRPVARPARRSRTTSRAGSSCCASASSRSAPTCASCRCGAAASRSRSTCASSSSSATPPEPPLPRRRGAPSAGSGHGTEDRLGSCH